MKMVKGNNKHEEKTFKPALMSRHGLLALPVVRGPRERGEWYRSNKRDKHWQHEVTSLFQHFA